MTDFFYETSIKSRCYWQTTLIYVFFLSSAISFAKSDTSVLAKEADTFQKPKRIAVLGDGFSQGEGSNPLLSYRSKDIIERLKGKALEPISKLPSLQTTWPSYKSFDNSLDWVFKNLLVSFAKLSTNEPQSSWGALTATQLGVPMSQVVIAARKEAGLSDFADQYEQALALNPNEYIDTVFIAFAGGDLCQVDPAFIPSSANFKNNLATLIDYMIKKDAKLPYKNRPLQIVVLNYIGITQILSSEEIGQKKKSFISDNKTNTCQNWVRNDLNLQQQTKSEDVEEKLLGVFFPINPKLSCPTLYAPKSFAERDTSFWSRINREKREAEIKAAMDSQLTNLASRVRNYRDAIKSTLASKKEQYSGNNQVKLFFVEQVKNITFAPNDIAASCAHINFNGQQKVAHEVLLSLKKAA